MTSRRGEPERFDPSVAAPAALYLALHRGNSGDLEFYQRRCEGARRILELGAGAGRLAIPLAAGGAEVVALELNNEMRALGEAATRRAVHAQQLSPTALRWRGGDMCTFSFGSERFERVLIPYNTLYCLPDQAAQRACLARAAAHLTEGGSLLLDGYQLPDPELYEFCGDDDFEAIDELSLSGERVVVEELDEHWQEEQRCLLHYRYRWPDGRSVGYALAHRYLPLAELEELLSALGLRCVERWGDFPAEPWEPEAPRWIVEARLK